MIFYRRVHPTGAWEQVGQQLSYIEGAVHWWIGDWLNYGERRWGEMYSQAFQEETGFKAQTLMDDKWVAGRIQFSLRKENLNFSHHKEVASLPPDAQQRWLDKAKKEVLTSNLTEGHLREISGIVLTLELSSWLTLGDVLQELIIQAIKQKLTVRQTANLPGSIPLPGTS